MVVQAVEAGCELVLLANTPAISCGDPALIDARTRTVVVGLGGHGTNAQRRAGPRIDIEIADRAAVVVVACRQVDLILFDEPGHLVHHVHGAPRGAAAKEQGGRAAEYLHAIQVEGVSLIESRVTHAVHKDITRALQRKAAQTNILLATFAR